MTEDQLEQQCLEWFAEGGWEIAHGPDLAPEGEAPERADYRQVLLLADLEAAIHRINPHLKVAQIARLGDFFCWPQENRSRCVLFSII